MSTGPIEFARSVPVDSLGSTEYGGDPGVVQGQPNQTATGLSGRGVDHLAHLTTAERLKILQRSRSTAFTDVVVDEDGVTTETRVDVPGGVDPVTGLDVGAADVEDAVPGVPASDFSQGNGLPG
jgi:hypothetical protein